MKKSLFLATLLILVVLLFAIGCEQPEEADDPEEPEEQLDPEEQVEAEEPAGADDEIVVTDQMGREVAIVGVPERIISLSPSNTEVGFALGLGDRIVGVTEFCNYPPEAQEQDNVGGFSSPSIEKIIELEPDLILASTIHEEEVPRLEEMGIPVLVVESSTVDELFESMSLVAEITDVEEAGEELITSMKERIDAVQEKVGDIEPGDRILVFYEVYSDPLMTAGRGSFIDEIISLAGGENIFGDVEDNYPQISAEEVAERQPDIILFPDYHGTAGTVLEEMAGRPGWESVPAVVNENLHPVTDDTFSRPGPRIVEAIEEAAKLFYPDKF